MGKFKPIEGYQIKPNYEKRYINAEVEDGDGGPMVLRRFEFTVDTNGATGKRIVRANNLRKKVAWDCLIPPDLIVIKVERPDNWSDDDGDLVWDDPRKGLPNTHPLNTNTKHIVTIDQTLRRYFPDDLTPEALDASNANACEEYMYCGLWKKNPHFQGDDILLEAINDVWERLHLANAILKFRPVGMKTGDQGTNGLLPAAWFSHKDQYGTNAFMKACFCREDMAKRFMREGFVTTTELNQVNHHGQSALTAAIYNGMTELAIMILDRPDLKSEVITETGSENMMKGRETNAQMCWRLYEVTFNKNEKQMRDEKFHEDVITKVLDKPLKNAIDHCKKTIPGYDPNVHMAMHTEVLHGKRGYDLRNEWAAIREKMVEVFKKRNIKIEDVLKVAHFGEVEKVEYVGHPSEVKADHEKEMGKMHPGSSVNPVPEMDYSDDSSSDSSSSDDDDDGGSSRGGASTRTGGTTTTGTSRTKTRFSDDSQLPLPDSDDDYAYEETKSRGSFLSKLFGGGNKVQAQRPQSSRERGPRPGRALRRSGSDVPKALRDNVVKGNPDDVYDQTYLDTDGEWHLDDGQLPPQRKAETHRSRMRGKALVALEDANQALELIESGVLLLPEYMKPNLPKGCMVADDGPTELDYMEIYEDGQWKPWGDTALIEKMDKGRYEGDKLLKHRKYVYDLIGMTRNGGGIQRIIRIKRGKKDVRGLLNPMFVAQKHPRYNESLAHEGFKDYTIGWDQIKVAKPHYTAFGHLYPKRGDILAEYQQQELWVESEGKRQGRNNKERKMIKDPGTGLMRKQFTAEMSSYDLNATGSFNSQGKKKGNMLKRLGTSMMFWKAAKNKVVALNAMSGGGFGKRPGSGSNILEQVIQTTEEEMNKGKKRKWSMPWSRGSGSGASAKGADPEFPEGVRKPGDPITQRNGKVWKPELSQHEENLLAAQTDPLTQEELEAAADREDKAAATRGKGYVGGTGNEQMSLDARVDAQGKATKEELAKHFLANGGAAVADGPLGQMVVMAQGKKVAPEIAEAASSLGTNSAGNQRAMNRMKAEQDREEAAKILNKKVIIHDAKSMAHMEVQAVSTQDRGRKKGEPKKKVLRKAETRESGADEYEGWNAPKSEELGGAKKKKAKKTKGEQFKEMAF